MQDSQLIPLEGGDPVPLIKNRILIGRRPDCDLQLSFANVSGKHCELVWDGGSWLLRDLKSSNGTKVNGSRVDKKRLIPGDQLTMARKHSYRIEYTPIGLGITRTDKEEEVEEDENIMKKSLLERAGLTRAKKKIELDSDVFEENENMKNRIKIDDD